MKGDRKLETIYRNSATYWLFCRLPVIPESVQTFVLQNVYIEVSTPHNSHQLMLLQNMKIHLSCQIKKYKTDDAIA